VNLDLAVDANWVLGLLLATTRVGAFVVAAPQLGSAIPTSAKLGFTVAIGWFLVGPVGGEVTLARLIGLAAVNAGVGVLLGWLLGVLFHMFAVAGSLIDVSAGTSIGAVLDPTRGDQGAVFSRFFQIAGLALFHALGGLALLVSVLAWSTRAVPLDGVATFTPAVADAAGGLVSRLMVAGTEVAMPVLAVLMMTELVLALAARFAPTANVFLLGLPAKTLLAITMAGMSVALFPEAVDGLLQLSRQTAIEVLNGIGVR
jgi:flagellar biosynthetic protein FliR